MTRARWLALGVFVAAALVLARAVAAAVVDYRWYLALGDGAVSVWRARAVALGALRGAAALAGAAFVYANLLGVVSSVETVALPRRVGGLEIAERVPAARLRWVSAAVAPVLGLVLASTLEAWTSVDALVTGRTLGEIEPYTGHDLAFFVHWLPLENALYAWALLTLVVTAGLVFALYALTPGLRWADGRPRVSTRVRRHLTVFGAGVLLLLAWGHRLDAYALLSGGSGEAGAFTGADQLGAMPARFVLGIATALASLVVLRAGWANQRRLAFWTVTAVVVSALVVRAAAVAVTVRVADPVQLAQADAAAGANRALYTQRAFAVDRLRTVGADYDLPAAGGGAVSAWDAPTLAVAVAAARRTAVPGDPGYFPVVDAGATTLAAVVVEATLPIRSGGADAGGEQRTVVTLDATRADAAGRPVPIGGEPLADAGRRVRLVCLPGAEGSLDVRGDARIVGDPLDDWRVRLAHALAGRDLRLAAEGDEGAGRLVERRDVRERVDALVPFFAVGRAVTPIAVLDSVWYAVSLYGAADSYPLAQRYAVGGEEWSAFRHAGTALVNAQSGAVRIVLAPDPDADTRAWQRRFPRLFVLPDALPLELARALPPATEGASVQADAFARFGARGERAPVLRREPPADGSDTAVAGPGRAFLLLPQASGAPQRDGGAAIDLVSAWTLPLVSATDRVDGLLVALGGPTAETLWLPTAGAGPRWQEVLDALAGAGDPTPGESGGGAVVRGRLRAVPIRGGVAYVRPDYRIGNEGVPSLSRVVASTAAGTRVAATPDAALQREQAPGTGAARVAGLTDPLSAARRAYQASREALRRGDWGAVGRALDALGSALGESGPAAPAPAAGGRP